jgi:uncharacterized protein (TIGR03437 family)
MIDTFAGGQVLSGVSAQNVTFGRINGVTRDPKGNLVFCDSSTNVIRRINADGTIQTIAGLGIPGYGGDGGTATSALLNNPEFPKYDSKGNLYFLDGANLRIRRIDAGGIITTVAGTGIEGILGADGAANLAEIGYVVDLAVDDAGYVYLAERSYYTNNVGNPSQVRRITPSGSIEVYAGCAMCDEADGVPATQVGFMLITALAADAKGNLFISDGSHILRVSSDGVLHHFAGFGPPSANMGNGGPALQAPGSNFIGLAADSAGNVYTEEESLAGGGNGGFIIRRIGTDGVINVAAGSFQGSSDADGPALQAFLSPTAGLGLTANPDGSVVFAEDYRLRQLTVQSTIETVAPAHPQSAADGTAARDAWFAGPTSIAFNRSGDLYIGQSCLIQKIDSTGKLATIAGNGQCSTTPPNGPALTTPLNGVQSIAVDSHNQVYFADVDGSVYLVSTAGVISTVATPQSAGVINQGGFLPKIVIDSQDRIYLASSLGLFERIVAGTPPKVIGQPPLGPLGLTLGQSPGIAVDSADNVYICCGVGGAMYRYAPDLASTRVSIPGSFPLTALAVDASSNVWQGSQQGLKKNTIAFGGGCCSYGDGGPAESAYIPTSALAFAPNGDLYVLDSDAGRVRRIHGSPPTAKPAISPGGIVNATSYAGTAIAPGELVSIFGSNFGPAGLDLGAPQNSVIPAALNNAHVYFGGTPGKITARTANQINVFVPYSTQNATSTKVTVDIDGVVSGAVSVPVAASAFGISTHDASGSGQGAIFNQDGTLNSHANPAARGTIVTLFGTGEGVTTPTLPDGALEISTPYSMPQSPVIVKFADQNADVKYAGAAPFLPTGVFQINAVIPDSVTPGDVPITVSIAGIGTTRTVTVAVE